ncbi:MAG: site-2 protease family protein [Ktedonobacterales bacterium]
MINIFLVVETFVAFVLAITVHEAAHASMASLLGDTSPSGAGRLSLAPARQMAAIGTIVAIVFSFAVVPAGLGWGRSVDVDARRMRVGPNSGLILVALAGPLVNLLLGLIIAFLLTVVPGYAALSTLGSHCIFGALAGQIQGKAVQQCLSIAQPGVVLWIEQFAFTFALTNVVLALINVIPLHPLDGYRVLYALLPGPQAIGLRRLEPYMELILLVIFFVVPYVLAFVGISFSPGNLLISLSLHILSSISPNVGLFYLFL